MAWLDRIFGGRVTTGISPASDRFASLFGGSMPRAGIAVDELSAYNYSVVWACVRVIAETLASLPWHTYSRQGDRKERISGPLERLLHVEASEEIDSQTFRETDMGHVLTWGNGYAEIERTRAGAAHALHLLLPNRVNPVRDRQGRLVYDVHNPGEPNIPLAPRDIFHVHGLGFNGLSGFSPIRLARETIAGGLALEAFGNAFFGNGAHPGHVIERPAESGELSDKARTNLREEWMQLYGGLDGAHKPAILGEGMTVRPLTVAPEEAQFIESRKFVAEDVASRWYRVPLYLVGLMDRATIGNTEHESIAFVRYTLRMWARKLEIEADRKLVQSPDKQYTKIDLNGLLRGDTKTRGSFYRLLMDRGVFSINDVLELEDRNPIGPAGDLRLVPMNMVPIEHAGERQANNAPAPGRNPDDGGEDGRDNDSSEAAAAGAPAAADAPISEGSASDTSGGGGEAFKAAAMPVLTDLCGRLIRKEANAAQRQGAKDAQAFEAWARKFYEQHQTTMCEGLEPACRTLLRLHGSDPDRAERIVADFAQRLVARGYLALTEAHKDGGGAAVASVLEEWERERAAEMAVELGDALVVSDPDSGSK